MQDCDGEFSAHEHSMMRNSSLNTSASSRTASRRFRLQDENHIGLSRQLNKSNYGARLGSIPPNIMDTDLRSAYLNSNTGRVTKVVQLRPHPHPMILLSRWPCRSSRFYCKRDWTEQIRNSMATIKNSLPAIKIACSLESWLAPN